MLYVFIPPHILDYTFPAQGTAKNSPQQPPGKQPRALLQWVGPRAPKEDKVGLPVKSHPLGSIIKTSSKWNKVTWMVKFTGYNFNQTI